MPRIGRHVIVTMDKRCKTKVVVVEQSISSKCSYIRNILCYLRELCQAWLTKYHSDIEINNQNEVHQNNDLVYENDMWHSVR